MELYIIENVSFFAYVFNICARILQININGSVNLVQAFHFLST